jgi:hypothetical protein
MWREETTPRDQKVTCGSCVLRRDHLCANLRCWWSCKERLRPAAGVVIPCCYVFHLCVSHSRLAGFMWSVVLSVVCSGTFTCRCFMFCVWAVVTWVRRGQGASGFRWQHSQQPIPRCWYCGGSVWLWQVAFVGLALWLALFVVAEAAALTSVGSVLVA